MTQVRHPCHTVVPISHYTIPGDLHGVLRRYKDARCPRQRVHDTEAVGELVARFLRRHEACLAGGHEAFDLLATVPSSKGRPGPHPLIGAIRTDPWLAARHQELLARGPAGLGHARASDLGFSLSRAVDGARIVLLDDTWTTGARAQSAASALQSHGARVLAIVVVGRLVDPGHTPLARRWWRDQVKEPFNLDQCCHEAPRHSTRNDHGGSSRSQE
jgi:hypothetical protein